jgi:hypothetical protein
LEELAKAFAAGIALFAGYAFIKVSHVRRFTAEHLRADRFALHLLGHSGFLIVLGAALAEVMPAWTQHRFAGLLHDVEFLGIAPATINAIVLGVTLAVLDNFRVLYLMRKDPAVVSVPVNILSLRERLRTAGVARYVRRSTDPSIRALFRAVYQEKLVMVTLKDRKVYVGDPVFPMSEPSTAFSWLRIIPFASGCRDDDSKRLTITTKYYELDDQLIDVGDEHGRPDTMDPFLSSMRELKGSNPKVSVDAEDLGIVIAWHEVQSLSLFDVNVYNWFQDAAHRDATTSAAPAAAASKPA